MALLAGLLALGVASSARAQGGDHAAEEDAADERARGVGVIDDLDPEAVPPSPAPARAESSGEAGAPAAAPGGARWGDGRASRNPRQQPAHGAPYAWRQMVLSAAVMVAMLGVLVWIIRRQTRAR